MKIVNSVDEINFGGVYQMSWMENQITIAVNSIEKNDNDSCFVNDNQMINFSYMIVNELEDDDKVKWCKTNCCGCDYCGGCKEDGSKCEYAPSIKIIKQEMEI